MKSRSVDENVDEFDNEANVDLVDKVHDDRFDLKKWRVQNIKRNYVVTIDNSLEYNVIKNSRRKNRGKKQKTSKHGELWKKLEKGKKPQFIMMKFFFSWKKL